MKSKLIILLLSLFCLNSMAQINNYHYEHKDKDDKEKKDDDQPVKHHDDTPKGYTVSITCNVGALIWVDGEARGCRDWSGYLKTGSHHVEATCENYEDYTKTIKVDSKHRKFNLSLTRNAVSVQFSCNVPDAALWIDGDSVGSVNKYYNVRYGRHTFKATADFYKDYSNTFDISSGTTKIIFSMAELTPDALNSKGVELHKKEQHSQAAIYYRKAAEQGNKYAQFNLGLSYYYGRGVEKNYTEAVKWFQKAVEQGYANAQYKLGVCHYYGRGVTQSYAVAVKWFQKAADQGNADAQCDLGFCYYKGQGVTQSYAVAVKWFQKAADQGYAQAQCNLGKCYHFGYGVTKSYAEAVKLYQKAAERGNAEAQYHLGYCYHFGYGVTENYQKAIELYQKAARQGYKLAQDALQRLGETW